MSRKIDEDLRGDLQAVGEDLFGLLDGFDDDEPFSTNSNSLSVSTPNNITRSASSRAPDPPSAAKPSPQPDINRTASLMSPSRPFKAPSMSPHANTSTPQKPPPPLPSPQQQQQQLLRQQQLEQQKQEQLQRQQVEKQQQQQLRQQQWEQQQQRQLQIQIQHEQEEEMKLKSKFKHSQSPSTMSNVDLPNSENVEWAKGGALLQQEVNTEMNLNDQFVRDGDSDEIIVDEEIDQMRDLDKEFEAYKDETFISRLQRFDPNVNEATVSALLPTGIVVDVCITMVETFGVVRERIFALAKQYPLSSELKEPSEYSFSYINNNADLEELVDDGIVMMSLPCSRLLLKVALKRGTKKEKILNSKIGALIGKALLVYGSMNDREVDDFRRTIGDVLSKASEKIRKSQNGWELFSISPFTNEDPIPPHIRAKFTSKGTFLVHCYFIDEEDEQHSTKFILPVEATTTPLELIEKNLSKRAKNLANVRQLRPEDYVLNIRGTREYLHGPYGMGDFVYIRDQLAKEQKIEVMLSVKDKIVPQEVPLPTPMSYIPSPPMEIEGSVDLTANFQVRILRGSNIATGTLSGLYIRAGLFHGGQPICKQLRTGIVAAAETTSWNEMLTFEISLHNIPRECRLCITLYGVWFNNNQSQEQSRMSIDSSGEGGDFRNTTRTALAWVNCNLFDFHGCMRAGMTTLHTWPCDPDDPVASGNPIGTVVPNPDRSCTPALTIQFLQNCIHEDADADEDDVAPDYDKEVSLSIGLMENQNKDDMDRLNRLALLDPLAASAMDAPTKEFLWRHRYFAIARPDLLPKLLLAVRWNDSEVVREVHQLLHFSKPLKPANALQLLDSNFADSKIRQFAVKCLENLSDFYLLQYLMQLIQVLKYEAFLDCALSRFLLYRALINKRVGHYFFWYLRSEMHAPEVSVRYGLLLEAYCRGNVLHMEDLRMQMDAMQGLVHNADAIKKKHLNTKEKKLKVLRDGLTNLNNKPYVAPLNSSICVKKLRPEKCSFMDSKKMPLWLVYENEEPGGDDVCIIFKSGDDLRQDMLTLQMIKIMDSLWQKEGLDLKMIPYDCISTGDEVGMIEVVLNSKTVWHIQARFGGGVSGAFKDDVIHKWLTEMNPGNNNFVENFTLSCAGYCVATCVLGIGDRHNDNIMVKTSGQFFHIDFGHFLGNFKSKFGIRRERVPFVLTPDMIYVMCGKKGRESEQFVKFKNICKQAFTIIRRNASLFINLFAMMLSTGIPQLRTPSDIEFLRSVLLLDGTEKEAVAQFEKMIEDTLDNGWTTRINWAIHGMVH